MRQGSPSPCPPCGASRSDRGPPKSAHIPPACFMECDRHHHSWANRNQSRAQTGRLINREALPILRRQRARQSKQTSCLTNQQWRHLLAVSGRSSAAFGDCSVCIVCVALFARQCLEWLFGFAQRVKKRCALMFSRRQPRMEPTGRNLSELPGLTANTFPLRSPGFSKSSKMPKGTLLF